MRIWRNSACEVFSRVRVHGKWPIHFRCCMYKQNFNKSWYSFSISNTIIIQENGLIWLRYWRLMSYSYLFLQLLAQWCVGIRGLTHVSQTYKWMNDQGICICLHSQLISPVSRLWKPHWPRAIHSVSKCRQPAHGSNQGQAWFMLPAEWAREGESSTADLLIAESLKIE